LIITAGRPGKQPLLVRAVDEILGTHNAKAPRRREPAGRAGRPFRHRVLTHPWRRPSAGLAVDAPMRGCDSVTVAAGDLSGSRHRVAAGMARRPVAVRQAAARV